MINMLVLLFGLMSFAGFPISYGPNDTAQLFTPGLTFSGATAVNIFTGSADPSITPTFGSAGSLYLSSNGKIYVKQDAGLTSNWSLDLATVTSVALSLPSDFTVSGSPVTTSGTLSAVWANQSANKALMGGTSGAAAVPTFRSLVGADLPNPSSSTLGGIQSTAGASNQWISTISTSGVPGLTQPAFSNLSGILANTQMVALIGDVTTTGSSATTTIANLAVTNAKIANSTIDLTAKVTGKLPVANGGTGSDTLTLHGLVIGQGTSAVKATTSGTSGQIIISQGSGADPIWSTPTYPYASGTSGQMLRSDGTNVLYSTATYPNTATTSDLLYASATNVWSSLAKVNSGALISTSAGVPAWTSGSTANRVLRTDGTSAAFAQVALATDVSGTLPIANGGTNNASLGVPAGGALYTDGSKVMSLAAGTSGAYYVSQGASPPIWQPAPSFAEAQFNDQAGYGSAATVIPYYTNTTVSNGNSIFTVANDSTNGAKVTMLKAAYITAQMSMYGTAGKQLGVSLNGSATVAIYSDTDAHRKCFAQTTNTVTGYAVSVSCAFPVVQGDIVRCHGSGDACGDTNSCSCEISAVSFQ